MSYRLIYPIAISFALLWVATTVRGPWASEVAFAVFFLAAGLFLAEGVRAASYVRKEANEDTSSRGLSWPVYGVILTLVIVVELLFLMYLEDVKSFYAIPMWFAFAAFVYVGHIEILRALGVRGRWTSSALALPAMLVTVAFLGVLVAEGGSGGAMFAWNAFIIMTIASIVWWLAMSGRLKSFAFLTFVLVAFCAFDVFMVFVLPWLQGQDTSLMGEATQQIIEEGELPLPMVLLFTEFILGGGDVIIPLLYVATCARADVYMPERDGFLLTYGALASFGCVVGYGVVLAMRVVGLDEFTGGLPALLGIVPGVLLFVWVAAYRRGEFDLLRRFVLPWKTA